MTDYDDDTNHPVYGRDGPKFLTRGIIHALSHRSIDATAAAYDLPKTGSKAVR